MGRTVPRYNPPPDVCDTPEEVAAYYDQVEDPYWEPDYEPGEDDEG